MVLREYTVECTSNLRQEQHVTSWTWKQYDPPNNRIYNGIYNRILTLRSCRFNPANQAPMHNLVNVIHSTLNDKRP